MSVRSVALATVVWASVVAAASGLAWAVIDAAGQDLLATGPAVDSAASAGPTQSATTHRASTLPAPSPSAATPGGSQGPAVPGTATAQERTWRGAAGTVNVRCADGAVSFRVVPNDGWGVAKAEREESSDVEVKFESGERQTEVHARCVGGVPAFEVEQD